MVRSCLEGARRVLQCYLEGLRGGSEYTTVGIPLGDLLCTRRSPTRSPHRALRWLARRARELYSL
eukprot:7654838-Pyramimonas_sp.AAC.2